MWIFWLAAIFVLSIAEISTVSLVSIWFIVSSCVALILSFIIDSFMIQFTVFAVLGIILMVTTRPILNKWLKPKNVKTNLDRVVGMDAIVTEEIKKGDIGEVKVDGKKWSAISNTNFKVGDSVSVLKIDGVKLIVGKKDL